MFGSILPIQLIPNGKFQIIIDLSSEEETICVLSEEKLQQKTLPKCLYNVLTGNLVIRSNIIIGPVFKPETSLDPSVEKLE